jgi:hypothetical protein
MSLTKMPEDAQQAAAKRTARTPRTDTRTGAREVGVMGSRVNRR